MLLTVLLCGRPAEADALVADAGGAPKSEDLFIPQHPLITLGLSLLTEHAGLSLALGAFVAGMLIAETESNTRSGNRHPAFHDVLLGLFFITIGMPARTGAGANNYGCWCCC